MSQRQLSSRTIRSVMCKIASCRYIVSMLVLFYMSFKSPLKSIKSAVHAGLVSNEPWYKPIYIVYNC